MIINLWIKLIKLHIKVGDVDYRGRQILEPFNAMMKRKQDRYSLLLAMENDSQELGLNTEQVKKEIKELEKWIEMNSEMLSSWDSSVAQIDEFYVLWDFDKVSEIDDKELKRAYLNQLPDKRKFIRTLKNMIEMQQEIIIKLEKSVKSDNKAMLTY